MELIRAANVEFDVVEYLKSPPSREELERIIELLDVPASELVRHDKFFKELGLVVGDYETPTAVAHLLEEYPRLMQRPVAVSESLAVIARPSDLVGRLLPH